ncbi:class I SAM-dependent methyltransferase [Lysobacter enzymogenes]|uniref:class I SAM-dependent methyltransferase n=1 Tax=Lysobacter enzymogenes TaxID=69 RepID=UPI001AF1802E|nr:class I SAM-dependent methyltransferase [Lysobacter enzymogenes]QQQ02351.1 class I SAM-dependent methyltransferase [Lysobacter enzymogenes]
MNDVSALHERVLHQLHSKSIHDPDFRALDWIGRQMRPLRTVLDVGANGGQTVATLRAVLGGDVAIHCFEANPRLWPGLDRIAGLADGAIEIHRCGLGAEPGELTLLVPSVDGVVYLEESSLDPAQFDKPWVREKYQERGGLELESVRVPIVRGDDFQLQPDLIKVDVEGFEAQALRGLVETIRRCRPALLVENSDWHNVTELLDGLDYAPYRWEGEGMAKFHGACTNTFYLPRELALELIDAAPEPAESSAESAAEPAVAAGGYDEASDVAAHRAEVDYAFEVLAQCGALPAADALVLDVGGGAGAHSAMIAGRVGRIYCSDFSDQNARFGGELVKLLQEKAQRNGYELPSGRLEFHRVDAMDLIYRDGLFDAIFSFDAFEHIPDPAKALSEMLRVLKPGGTICMKFDPMWTCDSGSHFQYRVPEPWQHLLSDDDAFVAALKRAGGSDGEAEEYRYAMNRRRLADYRAAFDSVRARAEFLHESEWAGCAHPDGEAHPNFARCLERGYTREELLLRGMRKVIRKRG